MSTYNVIEYKDNYSKISGRLYQYTKDEPALSNDNVADFNCANNTNSFIFKSKNNRLKG